MKKLISLLMALLLILTCGITLAEDDDKTTTAPSATDAPQATDIPAVTEAPAATEVPDEANAPQETDAPAERDLLQDGLQVTFIGLAGVFLVLILFFLMIKLMGKVLK